MANWCGMSRSNYFRVKDEAAFRTWAEAIELAVLCDNQGRVGFYSNTDDGGLPSFRHTDDEEGSEEVDLVAELAKHLIDGEIAVFMTIGHEKARYMSGSAVALNSEATHVSIDLSDIYERAAATFGAKAGSISEASY
jgi:hypothetical protein